MALDRRAVAAVSEATFRPIFERPWLPAICSAVSGSAWPKMCRDPAHPAVAVAQRGDGVPAVQSESLTLLRRDGIEMIPDFSYINSRTWIRL